MNYTTVTVTNLAQNCSLVWCKATAEAVIIDPGGDAHKIVRMTEHHHLLPKQILLTHGHADHVGAAAELAAHYQIPIVGPQREDDFWLQALPLQCERFGLPPCRALQPDRWLQEGDEITFGSVTLSVLHCPGHTPGHIVFYNRQANQLFSGDVLFKGGVGRTDFPRGDHVQLIDSIKRKLLSLSDEVSFVPGHGPQSTIGFERRHNPFLARE